MQFPQISDLDISGKRVFLRADLDVPLIIGDTADEGKAKQFVVADDSRLKILKPVVDELFKKGASQIIIAGHLGRETDAPLPSSFCLWDKLGEILEQSVSFWPDAIKEAKISFRPDQEDGRVHLIENLRLYPGESKNDPEFAQKLASLADVYVNEAFATAHREHASIVGVPKLLPHAAGVRFTQEVAVLSGVLENPKRPVVALVSGIKKDKLEYIKNLTRVCDRILVAGRLPDYVEMNDEWGILGDAKIVLARLLPDKEDITIHSIEVFEEEIAKAGTLILAGVPGKYEEAGHRMGTERIFKAVAGATGYKLVGGGDSEAALSMFNLTDKFDWICVGGGVMLEFLAKGTLPGIEALK